MTLYVYAGLCSLLAATNQYSVFIGQKMHLTGCYFGNEKGNATCAASKTSNVPTQDALLFISYILYPTQARLVALKFFRELINLKFGS